MLPQSILDTYQYVPDLFFTKMKIKYKKYMSHLKSQKKQPKQYVR